MTRASGVARLAVAAALLGACASAEEMALSTPQRPPQGQVVLEDWLAEGFHRAWRCEEGISSMRLTGNHGRHRICSNDLLLASGGGDYPVGAASVKEFFAGPDELPAGFAVGLKVLPGDGASTWYWYERRGSATRPLADGVGLPDCAVCHGGAPRDFVFIRAK